jgi:hypothetical protein
VGPAVEPGQTLSNDLQALNRLISSMAACISAVIQDDIQDLCNEVGGAGLCLSGKAVNP